ncbi:NAD(P)/FAD-dependent oxidoreductase [Nocardioides sp. CN2-186]|uniref:flavin monoamine oxidase family protein n=1 Tax=Nocardioides tweenelious TaxID=3156607 RepID=UPI0032B60A01
MHTVGRRGVLLGGLAGAAVAGSARPSAARGAPRVVVVGAGLAGLTTAHRLRQRTGWRVEVHEARDRVGGRALTVRDLPGGLHAEAGGSFVSTGDHAFRNLARELRVGLTDLDTVWPSGGYDYRFAGRNRSRAAVLHGRPEVAREAEREFGRIPWPVRHGTRDPEALRLDRMTASAWVERHVAPVNPLLADYVRTYVETEYTAPADEASALMVVADLAAPWRSYDERFVVTDGTDTVATALAEGLDGSIHLGSALVAVRRRAHGYRLTFEDDTSRTQVDADAVVFALPFPTLAAVDLSRAGFSPLKRRAIRLGALGVGMKASLVLDSTPWQPGSSGESFSDLATGSTWPGHPGQQSDQALMVCLTGASAMPHVAGAPVHGLAPRRLADAYLRDLDRVFPGSRAAYAGVTRVDRWVDDPWTRGTYSYYRVGTMTEIAGAEALPEGAAFFAGEHTAHYTNRSTLNGAVWSGNRAAEQVLAYLRR